MDPELMGRFVGELEHARSVIGEHAEAIRRVFAANGVPATSLQPIGEIEAWIDERLPELRRRNQMVRAMAKLPGWAPGSANALVPLDESTLMTPDEARRRGAALAERYKAIDPEVFWSEAPERYMQVINILAANRNNAEFTAAFFAELGPEKTFDLPTLLRDNGIVEGGTPADPSPDDQILRVVSEAFGSAIRGGSKVPGFAKVKEAAENPAEPDANYFGVSVLLSYGRFPAEWLASVVVAHGFARPRLVSAGFLYALGNNSGAARLAIAAVTKGGPLPAGPRLDAVLGSSIVAGAGQTDKRPELAAYLKELSSSAQLTDGRADAFGRMLAAASGAYDEKDGKHSQEAARFAFTVITKADEWVIGDATRVHLSEIAGSYATEMTEGANLGDDNQLLPSAFEPVTSRIAGLKPMFRLSPEDTYRFIATIPDPEADPATDPNLKPFHTGMGDLGLRLVKEGVAAMKAGKDPTRLDDAFAALGNVRGLELAAAEKLYKEVDDRVEEWEKHKSFAIGTAFGLAGFAVPGAWGLKGEIFWEGISTAWSAYDTYKPDPDKQVDKMHLTDDRETLGRQYAIAYALMDAGFTPKVSPRAYQATCPPGISIVGADGNLRPFTDIANSGDKGLRALEQWFIANGMGDNKKSLGEESRFLADRFDGRKEAARARGGLYGG